MASDSKKGGAEPKKRPLLRKETSERKNEVFQAILQIIEEKGIDGISTTEVARRVGISQPAIYRHFRNREEMIGFFIESLSDALQALLRSASEKGGSRQRLKTLLSLHLDMIEKNPVIPRLIFSDLIQAGNPQNRIRMKGVIDAYRSGIQRILDEGIRMGEIRPLDSDGAANFILGFVLSSALRWMLDGRSWSLKGETEGAMALLNETLFVKRQPSGKRSPHAKE